MTSKQNKYTRSIERSSIIREKLISGQTSPLKTYKELTFGKSHLFRFILYEILTSVLGPMPGAIGYFLRKMFYPKLFQHVGRGLIIGRNVVIRHPHRIRIGDNVTIDDNCIVDGRGAGEKGIILEDNVLVNRNCMILAKTGPIRLGKRTSLGSNSSIVSIDGVDVGEAVLTAGGCYLSAGSYRFDDTTKPIMDQEAYTAGPIHIGDRAWLGTRVTVLDGVTIGENTVIGAGALVIKDIPPNAIAFGVPAKVVRMRD